MILLEVQKYHKRSSEENILENIKILNLPLDFKGAMQDATDALDCLLAVRN